MPKYKIEVTRRFFVSDAAIFDIEADTIEEAKKFALYDAEIYPHLFEPWYEPDIDYEIEDDAIEQVDDDEPNELRWGEND